MFANALSMILQFALISLVMAEETLSTSSHGDAWKFGTGGGVIGFIVLILDIMAWSTYSSANHCDRANEYAVEVLKSNRPPSHKLLWCVGVFIFPVVGLIVYWLFSDRAAHTGSGSYEAIP